MKNTLLLLSILTIGFSFGQSREYSGVVIAKADKLPLPGVSVIIKGTKIGTQTDFNGRFTISVPDSLKILQFSYIGMITQGYQIKDNRDITIVLKEDCNIDWFDERHIGFYLNSGLLNNPIGGKFHFSFTPNYSFPTIKTGVSYQTNLKENRLLIGYLNFHHLFVSCDFNLDINTTFTDLDYDNDISSSSIGAETSLNFNQFSAIIGASTIDFYKNSENKMVKSVGPTIGLGTWIGQPFMMSISAKTTFYDNLNEYQAEIKKQYRGIYGFIKYYKLNEFNEISMGLGIELSY